MLQLENLRRAGVAPVSLSLESGACLAIMGPSGAGKSLLLRAICDLDPSDGDVTLDGRSRMDMSAPEWRRRVVYVPAESGWWSDTVRDHMSDVETALRLAIRLGFPETVLSWSVSRLSTGERQRLALVRALCLKPAVLLLDEPTAALDRDGVAAVEALVREQLGQAVSVVLVTHDRTQAERLAAHVLVMQKGRVMESGEAGA